MTVIRNLILAIAVFAAGAVMSPAAMAGDPIIDAGIEAGTVGERIDGLLGVVGSADAQTVRKVQEVNNKRRALYERVAQETGTTISQVARVTGEKQIAKLSSGQHYMDEAGNWKRK